MKPVGEAMQSAMDCAMQSLMQWPMQGVFPEVDALLFSFFCNQLMKQ